MRYKRENIIRYLSALSLALFLSYYADITLFRHSHIINGVTIVHSHFYNDEHRNSESGGHTESQITLFAKISSFLSLSGKSFFIDTPSFIYLTIFPVDKTQKIETGKHYSISTRGPPAV